MVIGQHIGYPPRLHRWAGTAPTPHPPAPAHPEATLGFYSSTQSGSLQAPASMVSLRGVSKVFPNGNLIFQDVNLEVRRGEFVFVTGVSGAGKSTLLRLLYGAEQATEGTVIVDQVCLFSSEGRRRPYRIPPRPLAMLRRRLGVVFQDYRLLANRTLAENVAFVLRAQGLSPAEIRRRIGPTLKMVGLTEKRDHFPHELSGGEQQRLSLARAIVNMPVLLLADEPTGET
jgi:cell division transport system ATP-binding protein